jgi:RND superfamily putative drug exporter
LLEIVAFAPSLMMSLLVAMSIDYSLFLLSRYREEILDGVFVVLFSRAYSLGRKTKEAVTIMLSSAGMTVLISGITLCGAFAGISTLFFPIVRVLIA